MHRRGQIGGADGVGNGAFRQAGDGDDVACLGFLDGYAIQAAERQQLGQAAGFDDCAVLAQHLHLHVQLGFALLDAPGQHAAQEIVVFQDAGDHGEGGVVVDRWRRDVADDHVEHRRQILARPVDRRIRPALTAGGVQHGEVELSLRGVERREQVEHFFMHFVLSRVLAVDLVDHDDRLDAARQGLADHELGLRQHAFRRVDQHDGAVDHTEDAFDFTAEVGMSGGIDDVDAHAFPHHRRALCQDGDSAFFFQVVAVQRAVNHMLMLPERAGLAEEFIDERGLAMIDVGDDGDVTNLHVGLAAGDVAAHT